MVLMKPVPSLPPFPAETANLLLPGPAGMIELACGVPALLSDVPGQREIAGDAARYFADGDPKSLARALPELLTEDARARAREAGPAAARRYDAANVARRLEEEFRAALAMLAATGTP